MNVVLPCILQEASSEMGGMSINNKKPGWHDHWQLDKWEGQSHSVAKVEYEVRVGW
jgi:hypothetical protein